MSLVSVSSNQQEVDSYVMTHTWYQTMGHPANNVGPRNLMDEVSPQLRATWVAKVADPTNSDHRECLPASWLMNVPDLGGVAGATKRAFRANGIDDGNDIWIFTGKIQDHICFNYEVFKAASCIASSKCLLLAVSAGTLFVFATGTEHDPMAKREVILEQFVAGMDIILDRLIKNCRVTIHGHAAVDSDPQALVTTLPSQSDKIIRGFWKQLVARLSVTFQDESDRNHLELTQNQKNHYVTHGANAVKPKLPGLAKFLHDTNRAQDAPEFFHDVNVILNYGTPGYAGMYHLSNKRGFEEWKGVRQDLLLRSTPRARSLPLAGTTTRPRPMMRKPLLLRPMEAAATMFFSAFKTHFLEKTSTSEEILMQSHTLLCSAIMDFMHIWRKGLFRNPKDGGTDLAWFESITEDDLFTPLKCVAKQIPIWIADRILADTQALHPSYVFQRKARDFKKAPHTAVTG